jgi:hypothetical protein
VTAPLGKSITDDLRPAFASLASVLRRLLRRASSHADAPYNLNEQARSTWQERAEAAARALRDVVGDRGPVTIADLGCGDCKLRTSLHHVLGERLRYRGFDILPQSADVEQLDLERDPIPGSYDAVALLGVGEYATDLSGLLAKASSVARFLCFSYTIADSGRFDAARVAERGWKHHYSRREIDAFAALSRCASGASPRWTAARPAFGSSNRPKGNGTGRTGHDLQRADSRARSRGRSFEEEAERRRPADPGRHRGIDR